MKKNILITIIVIFLYTIINVNASTSETIDLTGIATGTEINHNCANFLVTKYNTSIHWTECAICNKQFSISSHQLITTGQAGCSLQLGYQYQSCNCGYSIQLPKKAHVSGNKWYPFGDRSYHYTTCSECGVEYNREVCKDQNGNILGCSTGRSGTCIICGSYKDGSKHGSAASDYDPTNTKSSCLNCGTCMLTYTLQITPLSETSSKYTFNITLSTGVSINTNTIAAGSCNANLGETYSNIECYQTGPNTYVASAIVTFDKNRTVPITKEVHLVADYSYFGTNTNNHVHLGRSVVKSDNYAPSYYTSNVNYYNTKNNFATKTTINVSFNETYDNTSYIRLLDSNQSTVLSDWASTIKQGTLFTRSIDLVDEINGTKVIYVQAKDTLGNTSGLYPIYITNLDSKPPVMTSALATDTNWSQTKNYTTIATDMGSGNLKIACNNPNTYTVAQYNGNTYSKNFLFTGDVYGSVKVAMYITDSVDNTTTKFITVSNLDNTPPNITNTNVSYVPGRANITVTADDIKVFNATYKASGSGVAGYAITNTNQAPNSYQTSNVLTITKNGIYYIWVKDTVGNVTSKQIIIDKLECEIITQAGIGGIISNKTKVIYNESTSVFIVPMKGYEISNVLVDGMSVGKVNTYNFFNVNKNHTIVATFNKTNNWINELNKMNLKYNWINIK